MGFRQLVVTSASKLSIENQNIKVSKKDGSKVMVPIEDVNIVYVEDFTTIFTSSFLVMCSDNFIPIFVVNNKYEPVSLVAPLKLPYNHLNIFYKQIEIQKDIKDELWNQIIAGKILNQMHVIKNTVNDDNALTILDGYIPEIKNGDIANREGIAAKVFFRSVYGSGFIRFYDDSINAAMNYGYKVLVTSIIKSLYVYGLDPKLGIWHSSKANLYNLAYDIIEPFRAVVDYYVYNRIDELSTPLSFTTRMELIDLLNKPINIDGRRYTVQTAIDKTVLSYVNVLLEKGTKLALPEIVEIDFNE